MSLSRQEKVLIGSAAVIGVSVAVYAHSTHQVVKELKEIDHNNERRAEILNTQMETILAQNSSSMKGIEEVIDSIDECSSILTTNNGMMSKILRRDIKEVTA